MTDTENSVSPVESASGQSVKTIYDELGEPLINFYISFRRRQPTFAMPYEHTHKLTELYFLQSGLCNYRVNGTSFNLRTGDFLIVAPGDSHAVHYYGKDTSERINLFLNKDTLPASLTDFIPDAADVLSKTALFHPDPEAQDMIRSILELIFSEQNSHDYYREARLWLYTAELMLLLRGRAKADEDLFIPADSMENDMQYAIHYVERNYASPLSLAAVSKMLNLNSSYFSHKFHASTGTTFSQYVNTVRLKKATGFLLVSDDSITQIAMECGFSSGNYFKDLFRAKYGMSPREYRKKYGLSSKLGSGKASAQDIGRSIPDKIQ